MYQKIKAKFKANPTIFYACSIVASWAGVGSLMNFRTLAINNGDKKELRLDAYRKIQSVSIPC